MALKTTDIILLLFASKVVTKVTSNIIRTTFRFPQPKNQPGFRQGYSAMNNIHTINQVIEKCAEYNQQLQIALIDYEKVFDSVETSAVMQALRNQDVDVPYLRIPQDIYSGSTDTIVLIN